MMKRHLLGAWTLGQAVWLASVGWAAQPASLVVHADKSGPAISLTMHGVFFEDINYGADGGLYAELVQNRSFEHREALTAWTQIGRGAVTGQCSVEAAEGLNEANPHFLRIVSVTPGQGVGVRNEGFGGMALEKGEKYRFSVYARADEAYKGGLIVALEDEKGHALGQTKLETLGTQWNRYTATLTAGRTTPKGRLTLLATANGRVDLDVVSLMPENTFKDRPNGLRADLARMLADMRPGFMRFPGGCIVEGKDVGNMYRWKETIGEIAERKQNWNRWQDAVNIKAPQYYQTYGLGFFEYFQLCEDIGAEPVPILNCGMTCQYQTAYAFPMDQLQPFIQDTLDLIEFANGPVESAWGARRAAMGHPQPFHLKMIGVGNEQWGESYFQRYPVFYQAIKAKYPEIRIVTTAGPGVDDANWRLAWGKFKGGVPADIVDEHYYRSPRWFYTQSERYDGYDRSGPKVFAGEFAAHNAARSNNLDAALSEAAFMTGLERNADVVVMSSYAPLFAKVGNTQWFPDLIFFDNTRVMGTPSYYVQKLFSLHRGDVVLPCESNSPPFVIPLGEKLQLAAGTRGDARAEIKDLKVTQNGKTLLAVGAAEDVAVDNGQWRFADGVFMRAGDTRDRSVTLKQPVAGDMVFSAQVRRTGGAEGLTLSAVGYSNSDRVLWTIGARNGQHTLDVSGVAPRSAVDGRIETGRWYDARIELVGAEVKCYLDGQLVQQAQRPTRQSLYSVATRDNAAGEIVLKVVNPSAEDLDTAVELQGAAGVATTGRAIVLSSSSLDDVNTLEQPAKVAPKENKISVGSRFQHRFPAYSLTVLRIPAGRR